MMKKFSEESIPSTPNERSTCILLNKSIIVIRYISYAMNLF